MELLEVVNRFDIIKLIKMKNTYIGLEAQKTVGGSMHLLKVEDENYLIDAGIFYGDIYCLLIKI